MGGRRTRGLHYTKFKTIMDFVLSKLLIIIIVYFSIVLELASLIEDQPQLLTDLRLALQGVSDDQLRELAQKKTVMQLICPK